MSSHQVKLTTNTTLPGSLYADLQHDVDHNVKIDYNDHKGTPVFSGDPAFYGWPQSNFSPVCQISLLSILALMFPS
jgi:hypothetical protein